MKPTTYKQWRSLYRDRLHKYGVACFWAEQRRREGKPHSESGTRAREYLYRSLCRIDRRLDAEFEAMDASCCEAILEMVFRKEAAGE